MNTAPTRIWAVDGETPYYYEEGEERPAGVTEYVRIDLHQARIEALEKQLAVSEDMRKEWREHCMTAETRHWNAALEAAARTAQDHIWDGIDAGLRLYPKGETVMDWQRLKKEVKALVKENRLYLFGRGNNNAAKGIASAIRALMKKEGEDE